MPIDQELRELRYLFFTLPAIDRLNALTRLALVTPEMAKRIPLAFWSDGIERAVELGSADRLLTECRRIADERGS